MITRLGRYAEIAAKAYVFIGILFALIVWMHERLTMIETVFAIAAWPIVPIAFVVSLLN